MVNHREKIDGTEGSWVDADWKTFRGGELVRAVICGGVTLEARRVDRVRLATNDLYLEGRGGFCVTDVPYTWRWQRFVPDAPAASDMDGIWEEVLWSDLRPGDIAYLPGGMPGGSRPDTVVIVHQERGQVAMANGASWTMAHRGVMWSRFVPGTWQRMYWEDLRPGDFARQRSHGEITIGPNHVDRVCAATSAAPAIIVFKGFKGNDSVRITSEIVIWERFVPKPADVATVSRAACARIAREMSTPTPAQPTAKAPTRPTDLQLQARCLIDVGCDPRIVLGVLDERLRSPNIPNLALFQKQVAERIVNAGFDALKTRRCYHGHSLLRGACTWCAQVTARPDAAPATTTGPDAWDRENFEG